MQCNKHAHIPLALQTAGGPLPWFHVHLSFRSGHTGSLGRVQPGDVGELSGTAVCSSVLTCLQHMTRTFHGLDGQVVKQDSGIWINGFDYTGMSHITPHIPEINDTIRAPCEESAPLCGFPWYLPVHFLIRWVGCSSAAGLGG